MLKVEVDFSLRSGMPKVTRVLRNINTSHNWSIRGGQRHVQQGWFTPHLVNMFLKLKTHCLKEGFQGRAGYGSPTHNRHDIAFDVLFDRF